MKRIFIAITILFLAVPLSLNAQQQPQSPEEMERKFMESIDEEIDRLTSVLDLEDWQIFRVDSTLVHDYKAMREEMTEMNKSKISNYTIFESVRDKWDEQIYTTMRWILNDTQWQKYNKTGAGRDKKARDRRAASKQ